MEIDITSFVTNADPFDFSASRAERGQNAGLETWANATAEGASSPFLTSEAQLDAMRAFVKSSGGWDCKEIAAFSDVDLNALFIQWVSGDMREMGLDACELDDFDWEDYEELCQAGQMSGRIFKGGDNYYFELDC